MQQQKKRLHETGIHLLLEHGASVTAADHDGETPLHAAAFGSDVYIFQHYLSSLNSGLNGSLDILSVANSHGETLLHYAAAGGKIGIIRFLLESPQTNLGANRASSNGWTPLICALAPLNIDDSFVLPTNDEDSCSYVPSTNNGYYPRVSPKTPAEAIQAAQLLLSHGADPEAVTAEGWSALHFLACYESPPSDTRFSALAEALVQKGAPLQAKARSVTSDWKDGGRWFGVEGYSPACEDYFPWGFRMPAMAEVAPEGVFSAVATTAPDWARRYNSKAVEEVLGASMLGKESDQAERDCEVALCSKVGSETS